MKIDVPICDEDLLKGASLRFCRHFPALSIANSFTGEPNPSWIVARLSTKEIIQEIRDRGLDISHLETALSSCPCCHKLVVDSPLYQYTIKLLDSIH